MTTSCAIAPWRTCRTRRTHIRNSQDNIDTTIADNLARISIRIQAAARRAGRDPNEVRLVAVTKKVDAARVADAYSAGIRDFGESYVQEALSKQLDERIAHNDIRWHFIGHLQSNKARDVVGKFVVVHSVDSFALAQEMDLRARASGNVSKLLLQVKLDRGQTKFGIAPEDTLRVAEEVGRLPGISVLGLMGIPPFGEDPEQSRGYFRTLRSLFEKLPSASRQILSMGMTGDFEIAVEEGATLLRIGTGIFGARSA